MNGKLTTKILWIFVCAIYKSATIRKKKYTAGKGWHSRVENRKTHPHTHTHIQTHFYACTYTPI